jgi:hypothetical protein
VVYVTGYTLDYLLDWLTLEQVMMLYNYSFDYMEVQSIILVNKIGQAFFGAKKKISANSPDIKKFKLLYGDKIKTPEDKVNK